MADLRPFRIRPDFSPWPAVNDELQCRLLRVSASIAYHHCILRFPDDDCCDMTGAIRFCQRIDPEVAAIFTGNDVDTVDTTYVKRGEEWFAREGFHPKERP